MYVRRVRVDLHGASLLDAPPNRVHGLSHLEAPSFLRSRFRIRMVLSRGRAASAKAM